MKENHPTIIVIFVPGGCTGVWQPLDVGIQRYLKLSIKRSAHRDIVQEIYDSLSTPDGSSGDDSESESRDSDTKIHLDTSIPTLRDRSLGWIVDAANEINNKEIIMK
ncbi:hypothetical protein H0H92_000563, partial [Tricholoma furcatifolium]